MEEMNVKRILGIIFVTMATVLIGFRFAAWVQGWIWRQLDPAGEHCVI